MTIKKYPIGTESCLQGDERACCLPQPGVYPQVLGITDDDTVAWVDCGGVGGEHVGELLGDMFYYDPTVLPDGVAVLDAGLAGQYLQVNGTADAPEWVDASAGVSEVRHGIVVGNALNGDTLDDCDFLDPGDGSGIYDALFSNWSTGGEGGVLSLRAGTYNMPSTLPLYQNIIFEGAGQGSTILNGAFPMLGNSSDVDSIVMRDFTINSTSILRDNQADEDILIERVTFNATGTPAYAVLPGQASLSTITIRDSVLNGPGKDLAGNFVVYAGFGESVLLENNYIGGFQYIFRGLDDVTGKTLDFTMKDNWVDGVQALHSSTNPINSFTATGNTFLDMNYFNPNAVDTYIAGNHFEMSGESVSPIILAGSNGAHRFLNNIVNSPVQTTNIVTSTSAGSTAIISGNRFNDLADNVSVLATGIVTGNTGIGTVTGAGVATNNTP